MVLPLAWTRYVVPALLIATRLSGLLLVAPFFGDDPVPPRVKAALVIAATIILTPVVNISGLAGATLLTWMGDGLSELMIGLLLGLAVQVVFEAALLAGQVAGFQLGLGLETAIDPASTADSTVLATFHRLVLLYVFLQLGAQRWMLGALMASFTRLPLGAGLAAATARQLLSFAGNLWIWGLELVLPLLMVTMLIDVALGFFAKAAPQLPVIFFGIPIKALCGYAVLFAVIRFWPAAFERYLRQALNFFLQYAHPALLGAR